MGNIKNRQPVDRSLVKGILDLGVELTSDVYIHHTFDDDEAADLLRALAPEMTSSQVNDASKKAARIWAALESAPSTYVPLAETLERVDAILETDGRPDAPVILGLYALARASNLQEAALRKAVPDLRRGRKGAEGKHGKPDGTRAKKDQLQNSWATGKFKTRSLCAEQEYEALGVTYDTARSWLKGTPDPSHWPARSRK
jgi:hypothetical protein